MRTSHHQMRLRDQKKGNDLDDEGPEVQTPAKRMRFRKQSNPTITVQHEVNHKMCQEVHRGQKLQWKKERLFCAKQLFASQTIVARVSIPIFENDEDQSGTDTSIRRDAVEVSNLRLTEQEAIEMNEAKRRSLTEWIQEEAMRKVREDQEMQQTRAMSVR